MDKTYRYEYVIGDLQGCFASFNQLLKVIEFDENRDRIWLAGDIVARGEDSLATLRQVKHLNEQGALQTVLGNHDITLIATWLGVLKPKAKDRTTPIFAANDCDELLNWLRKQPLMVYPDDKTVLVHAGIPPNWGIDEALGYAKELETYLSGDLKTLTELLPYLYSKKVEGWHKTIKGTDKMRMIANYCTRMRLCDKHGVLEFEFSDGLNKRDKMPIGFRPWFEWKVKRERKILFGHWAALEAKVVSDKVHSLDGGCVWGGKLVAYRLHDEKIFYIKQS